MDTAVVNVKVRLKLKNEAHKVATDLGFSLSALINGFLKQLVRNKSVYYSLKSEEPSEFFAKALRESEKNRKSGKVKRFFSADDALSFLDQMINEKRKN